MSNNCHRCGNSSVQIPKGSGTLHLKFPADHIKTKALAILSEANIDFVEKDDLIAVSVPNNTLQDLARSLDNKFSRLEANDIKAFFEEANREWMFADVFNVRSLSSFIGIIQAEWLSQLIDSKSYCTYFQPIVSCSNPNDIHGFECLFRGLRGKDLISPGDIFKSARAAELISRVDFTARQSAIEAAVSVQLEGKIFINFSPSAIYDPVHCLAATIALIEANQIEPERICFEIVETEKISDVEQLIGLCNYYRDRGFGIVLDDLGSGYSSLTLITKLKPDYVKLDMDLIRDVDTDPFKATYTTALIDAAQRVGVRVVCEGVETDGEYQWVRAKGADYAQGYFFGRPSPRN